MRTLPTLQTTRGRGSLLATVVVLTVNVLFVVNNLAPYLGLNYVGAMTMFSGLSARADNHFFMPKVPLWDADMYVAIVRFAPNNRDTEAASQFRAFADRADEDNWLVHINFVRYHLNRVCASSQGQSVGLRLRTEAGQILNYADACAEPTLLSYALLSEYDECTPSCRRYLRRWARGEAPSR